MMKTLNPRKWLFLLAGLLLGLALTMSFDFTQLSHAKLRFEPAVNTLDGKDLRIARELSNAFASVAEHVNPSVVTIFTESTVKVRQRSFRGTPFEDFFGRGFGDQLFDGPRPNQKRSGLGSGVIVDSKGIVVTNNHVVDGADEIKVRLMDGREFKAKVKGTDPQTDLAVLTIPESNLTAIPLGNSDESRVGEWVLAIGSPLNPNLSHTVTTGIISAKGRSGVGLTRYEDYIQTDAAINPGNSGGALVNLSGELIGINSAIASSNGGNVGIGFAIPANLVNSVMADIIETGSVERGWLGVYIQNITTELAEALRLDSPKGVLVTQVQADSPAGAAGLKQGDVIIDFNGKRVENTVELSTAVAGTAPGAVASVALIRDGEERILDVKLKKLEQASVATTESEDDLKSVGLQLSNITSALQRQFDLPDDLERGAVVTAIAAGSVAQERGLRPGDVLLEINRKPSPTAAEAGRILSAINPGEHVLLYIQRQDRHLFVAFEMPHE